MAEVLEAPIQVNMNVLKAFATFTEIINAKSCSRNLRQMFFEFLKKEDSAGLDYFQDLVFEMDTIFDLLLVMEDECDPV